MIYGYIRVSSDKQTIENQKFEIEKFCEKEKLEIDGWISETISGTKNYDKIEDYTLSVEKNLNGIEETNHLSKEELMEEFMFLGLRKTSGVSEKVFFERFNVSMESIYKDVINNHVKKGLLNKDNGKIYLNKEGIQLSNYVMSDFLLS